MTIARWFHHGTHSFGELLSSLREGEGILFDDFERITELEPSDLARLGAAVESKAVTVFCLDRSAASDVGAMVNLTSMFIRSSQAAAVEPEPVASAAVEPIAAVEPEPPVQTALERTTARKRGRPTDYARHERIAALRRSGASYDDIQRETGASRTTIAKIVCR